MRVFPVKLPPAFFSALQLCHRFFFGSPPFYFYFYLYPSPSSVRDTRPDRQRSSSPHRHDLYSKTPPLSMLPIYSMYSTSMHVLNSVILVAKGLTLLSFNRQTTSHQHRRRRLAGLHYYPRVRVLVDVQVLYCRCHQSVSSSITAG